MSLLVTDVWGYGGGPVNGVLTATLSKYSRYGGGSVMVWGGICLDGRTDLVVIDRGALTAVQYQDEVLERVVRPFVGVLG